MLKRLFRRKQLTTVTATVDDSKGWGSLTGRPHDYDPGQVQQIYTDALEAWRKNPIAWRIISITTDYVIGDRIAISSTHRSLSRFVKAFWAHPQNRMALRLEPMADELARSGDLFVLLFRNPQDGMSYIRFVTKDRIEKIETAPNDWETELVYYETQETGEPKKWYSPAASPLSPPSGGRGAGGEGGSPDAVMLHYSVNRPLGALLGESDLTTILPWLLRYSRMLEDRVRLHAAMRAYMWDVTVPANTVANKKEQYRTPPEAGSILIHDPTETWQAITPKVEGSDAKADMQAVRAMLDAGSGYPPHWRGDAGDISLATAQAMQGPTERHLTRRQRYFTFILQDIMYNAYQRAAQLGTAPRISRVDYDELFTISMPDISRWDNESLARASRDLSQAYYNLAVQIGAMPPTLARHILKTLFKFSGEPQNEETITKILEEVQAAPPVPVNIETPETGTGKTMPQDRSDQKENPTIREDTPA